MRPALPASDSGRQRTLRRLLLGDASFPTQPQAQRQRLVTGSLLSVVVIGTLAALGFPTFGVQTDELPLLVGCVLLTALAYGMSRGGQVDAALWLFMMTATIGALLLASPVFEDSDPGVLLYLVIPLGFASLFFNVRQMLTLMVIQFGGILALPLLFPDDIEASAVLNLGILLLGLSLVVLASTSFHLQNLAQHRERLQRQAERLNALLSFSHDGVLLHREGVIVAANPGAYVVLGLDEGQVSLIGQPLERFFPQRSGTISSARRLNRSGQTAMLTREELRQADGTHITVAVAAMTLLHEGQLTSQLIVRDLSREQQLEDTIQLERVRSTIVTRMMSDLSYEMRLDEAGTMRLVSISGPLERVTGYTLDDLDLLNEDMKLVYPEDAGIVRQHLRRVRSGVESVTEYRVVTREGRVYWVRDFAHPIIDEAGQVIGAAGIAQDVTERLEAEMELKSHALQQAVVAELGQRAMRPNAKAEVLLDEALLLIAQVLDTPFARICEIDEAGVLVYRTGFGWGAVIAPGDACCASRACQTWRAFHSGEPVILTGQATEGLPPAWQRLGLQSGVSVVMHGQGANIGVLEVHDTQPREFDINNVNFLQAIANILAAFTEQQRVRAAEAAQRRLAEALSEIASILNQSLGLETVLEQMLDHLPQIIAHDAASIMLFEGDVMRVIRHRGFERYDMATERMNDLHFNVGDGTIASAMLERGVGITVPDVRMDPRWVMVPGNEWIRAYLGAPILYQGQRLGIINVDSATPGAYDETHVRRLQAFVDQASIAIRNAQRTQELAERVAERTRELELERRRIQTILEGTGEGIFYAERGIIYYTNRALQVMVGRDSDALHNLPVNALIVADPDPDAETERPQWRDIEAAVQEGGIWRGDLLLRGRSGQPFDAGLTVSLVDRSDEGLRLVTLVRDISQAKALEAQQSRFIANASHELRSPIASLNTRIYLMRRKPEKMDEHLTLLERVVERMNRLVEDLLDTSRFQNGVIALRRRNVVVQDVVLDIVALYEAVAEERGITLMSDIILDDPLSVYADPDRLAQVITNLVSNGLNYTESGGTVAVFVRRETNLDGQPVASIQVKDSGVGIAPADLENVFQPFFRGNNPVRGTGLGLSITREIIAMHDGTINVTSEVGVGSTFEVQLPLLLHGEDPQDGL